MRAVRRRLRLYAWLALLSVGALAICPTVSRMLLPGGGFAEFAPGARVSRDSQALATAALPHPTTDAALDHPRRHHDRAMHAGAMPVSPHSPSHRHALEHCGFCVLAAHAFAVVPVPAVVLVSAEDGRCAYGEGTPAVPRLRCDWSPASSRGPPIPA
jgi:hypothetical protein